MAQFKETQITQNGHHLLAKVLSKVTDLEFTRIRTGDGYFDGDVWAMTDIISPKLDGRIVSVKPIGAATEIECFMTNENLTEFFNFREIGIYAKDPEVGEILFAYTNAGEKADYIGAFNGQWFAEEHFTIQVYTANASNIKAKIVHTSVATEIGYDSSQSELKAQNIQEAIDELTNQIGERTVHVSATAPSDWKKGAWWYQAVRERTFSSISTVHETLRTIPYDPSKPYHVKTEGKLETIENTDDESLIIVEI